MGDIGAVGALGSQGLTQSLEHAYDKRVQQVLLQNAEDYRQKQLAQQDAEFRLKQEQHKAELADKMAKDRAEATAKEFKLNQDRYAMLGPETDLPQETVNTMTSGPGGLLKESFQRSGQAPPLGGMADGSDGEPHAEGPGQPQLRRIPTKDERETTQRMEGLRRIAANKDMPQAVRQDAQAQLEMGGTTKNPLAPALFRPPPTPPAGPVKTLADGTFVRINADGTQTPIPGGKARVPNPNADPTGGPGFQNSYKYADTQINNIRKPFADRAERLQRLEDTIALESPQADAMIAPELVTSIAGGPGSGVRVTDSELKSVLGGRTNPEAFKSWLRQFSLDPTTAKITPEQRKQMRDLVKIVHSKNSAALEALDAAGQDLIDAADVKGHRQIVQNARSKITAMSKGESTTKQGGATAGRIFARDKDGVVHEAAAGTSLPDGWTLVDKK